jgi:hypothetical protein
MPATGYQQEGRLKRTTGALCVAGLLTMILFSTTVAQSMRLQGALFIATNDEYTHLLTVRPDLELADLRTLLSRPFLTYAMPPQTISPGAGCIRMPRPVCAGRQQWLCSVQPPDLSARVTG